jgi:hypothetical protein
MACRRKDLGAKLLFLLVLLGLLVVLAVVLVVVSAPVLQLPSLAPDFLECFSR